ncbi:beta family protein [Nannocystis exedens]|uniref:beta family protein n=1 Tax=Nannocystis exedens TaxID=54 RepID=UPI001FE8BAD4|nr:beta family protein [Nannocystis exedens]
MQNLPVGDKHFARPMIEFLPGSEEEDEPGASYDKFVKQIDKSWGKESPICVELGLDEDNNPVEAVFERLRALELLGIPVTGVARDESFQRAVAAVAKADGRGALIRITPDEIAEVGFADDMSSLMKLLALDPGEVDVVVDAGFIQVTPQSNVTSQSFTMMGFLANLPHFAQWRTVTYAASAFPENLASITGEDTIPRIEWNVWKNVAARLAATREVLFGDYTAAHAIYSHVPYAGAANIRYTLDDAWLIKRGRKVTGPQYGGFGQYVKLSQSLIADPRYCGADFSWGDRYIHECANGEVGTGNMTTWRSVGTNHHIRYVLKQLASLSAP